MADTTLSQWPRLLDIRSAALYLGVSTRTIEQWIADEILRPVQMPGMGRTLKLRRVLMDRQDLDELIERQKKAAR